MCRKTCGRSALYSGWVGWRLTIERREGKGEKGGKAGGLDIDAGLLEGYIYENGRKRGFCFSVMWTRWIDGKRMEMGLRRRIRVTSPQHAL